MISSFYTHREQSPRSPSAGFGSSGPMASRTASADPYASVVTISRPAGEAVWPGSRPRWVQRLAGVATGLCMTATATLLPAPVSLAYAADKAAAPTTITLHLSPMNALQDDELSVNLDCVDAFFKPKRGVGTVVELEDGKLYRTETAFESVAAVAAQVHFVPFTLDQVNAVTNSAAMVNPSHLEAMLKPMTGRGTVVELENGHKYRMTEAYEDSFKLIPNLEEFDLRKDGGSTLQDSKLAVNPDLIEGVMRPTHAPGSILLMESGSKHPVTAPYDDAFDRLMAPDDDN